MKLAIAVAAALTISASAAYALKSRNVDDVWDVVVQGFPTRVAPEYASHNVDLYILRQTHEPLFRQNAENEQYESRILKSWERALDNKTLTLCPDTRLEFIPGNTFSAPFLANFLKDALAKMPKHSDFKVSTKDDCVTATFAESEPEALYFLSRYEQAPTIKTNDDRLEVGLGPYAPVARSVDKIILKRKIPVRHGYNSIVLHQWHGSHDALLSDHDIEDFNRIPSGDVPAWVKDSYANYGVNLLNTAVLVINHPDLRIRQIIYNCADVSELRKDFYVTQRTFLDVSTVTPVGLIASKGGLPETECKAAEGALKGTELTLFNYKSDNEQPLETWAKSFNSRSGLKIVIKSVPLQKFIDGGLRRPHIGNLYIMSLDTPYASYDDFFSGFVLPQDRVSLTDVDVPKLKDQYASFQAAKGATEKDEQARKLNGLLKDFAIALPLFQVVRPFYYPKRVEALRLGTDFLEYPEIGDLRL